METRKKNIMREGEKEVRQLGYENLPGKYSDYFAGLCVLDGVGKFL
jgi:hypothetical protein